MVNHFLRLVALLCLVALLIPGATPTFAADPPILTLPTPPGETWVVIQGYNCGSHDGWGRLSFDLVNNNGRTRGAPVYAAADGTLWYWSARSGTLILSHGDGYYTMYTHMQSHIDLPYGSFIARGQWIGAVGSVGAEHTVPHLHFTFFYGEGPYAKHRRPLPLRFAEGYDFPDEGTCNNHAGALVVAGSYSDEPPAIEWTGSPERAWSATGRVEWAIQSPLIAGFSYGLNDDPGGEAPAIEGTAGFAELSEPGIHTLFLRIWDSIGHQTLVTREIWYDPVPPALPVSETQKLKVAADQPVVLSWPPAIDELSGIQGYQVYTGPDREGTSEWFVDTAELDLGVQSPGRFYLRVRAQDHAGNFSPWTTIAVVVVH
ncbi:MAG: peptidase M23 [Herpetosiphonaceae bacterium]|nr:MAG: peptidase M23 [Herpetosiphonaceae bacterium]